MLRDETKKNKILIIKLNTEGNKILNPSDYQKYWKDQHLNKDIEQEYLSTIQQILEFKNQNLKN